MFFITYKKYENSRKATVTSFIGNILIMLLSAAVGVVMVVAPFNVYDILNDVLGTIVVVVIVVILIFLFKKPLNKFTDKIALNAENK